METVSTVHTEHRESMQKGSPPPTDTDTLIMLMNGNFDKRIKRMGKLKLIDLA